jgi:uncharacterized membrane protein YdcZ (DUF606 family)
MYHVIRSIGVGFLWSIGGYLTGALITYLLVITLSQNQHDRSVEAAMTAAFAGGPFAAIITFVIYLVYALRTH